MNHRASEHSGLLFISYGASFTAGIYSSAADLTEFCPQTSTDFLVFVLQAQRKSILNHRHDDNSRNQDMVHIKVPVPPHPPPSSQPPLLSPLSPSLLSAPPVAPPRLRLNVLRDNIAGGNSTGVSRALVFLPRVANNVCPS